MSVRLVFLGTGSGKPTPSRNASSVALFREGQMFMFDCGEGTQTQMSRSSLRSGTLEAILVTHFHGDHVNGLPGLLGTLGLNQREAPLALRAPVGLRRWFKTLKQVGIMTPSFPLQIQEIEREGVVLRGEGWRVEARALSHRIACWGYAFIEDDRPGRFDVEAARGLGVPPGPLFGELQRGQTVTLADGREVRPEQVLGPARPGLKIAYCCDTAPCEGAAQLARGADVLVHDSTYPAGDERSAKKYGHSTAGDAARCARDAGAKQLILTHFSQKHMNLEDFLRGARKIFPNVIAARDLMEHEVRRRDE